MQDFVTSGFTDDERQQFMAWSDGPRLFEHFRDLETPLRLKDLPAYVRALGYSTDLMRSKTLQGTPMRHRGVEVGHFFLAEKEGEAEFTRADEEILLLFASQGSNRDCQRPHAPRRATSAGRSGGAGRDLAGRKSWLLNAKTGKPATLNREARRIVEGATHAEPLRGGPAGGGYVSVRRRARSRAWRITAGSGAQQTPSRHGRRRSCCRSPTGRSVTMLINATPIKTEDGTVESVVVTMQDLAPLEELERQRAEFLSMVSHELRAPLTSIKGSARHRAGCRAGRWTPPRCNSSSELSISRPTTCGA